MEEAVIKRIMPHSTEAEQAVIGAMLMNKDAIMETSEILHGEDFYQTAYGILFDAMVEMFHSGKPVDLITLQEHLKEKNAPPEIVSMEYVRDLLMNVDTSANVKYYAQIVQEKSTLRKLIKINEEIANTCYMENRPLEEILETTEKKVFELVERGNVQEYVPIKQVVLNALDVIEKASKTKGTVTGIPTGFIDLDYKLSGLQRSDLVLIAARPSMGKTAFVLNIAQHVAFRENLAVAIFSLEMSKEQLVNRMLSLESHVDAQKIRTGRLNDEEWMNLVEGSANIANSKLFIDDTPGITLSAMRSKCRKLKMEHDIQIVIIDYLQLMSGNSGNNASRQQEISDISRGLKALARELNVPVIALSQLSRAVEQRPDHRPMLSDLRESGAIEQDADVVMFLYRDDYYHKDTEIKGIAEIITLPGYINVDFADVRTVMTDSGVAIMGAAQASGEDRAIRAITEALESPLLNNNDILGAKDILLNITSGTDEITMDEMSQITSHIIRKVGNNAAVIWGVGPDLGDAVSVTIIATGFPTGDIELFGEENTCAGYAKQPECLKEEEVRVKPGLTEEQVRELETVPAFERRDLRVS